MSKDTSLNNRVIAARTKGGAKQLEERGEPVGGYDPDDAKLPPHNNGSPADRARAHRAAKGMKGVRNAQAQPSTPKAAEKNLPVGKKTLT